MRLERGDCRSVMFDMAVMGEQFDACVTDPPYDLTSVVKRFGGASAAPAKHGTDGLFARQSRGFMGKQWDGTGVAFDPATWRAVYDVLKPGAYLLAFGGSRTYHRMACAIEDAGFEVRDCIMWLYGTGYPKSHSVNKGIDAKLGAERAEAAAYAGWGTALKPAHEPIVVARKPLIGTVAENVLAHGTGGLNIGACRIPSADGDAPVKWDTPRGGIWTTDSAATGTLVENMAGRWPANVIHDGSDEVLEAFAAYGERPGQIAKSRVDGSAQGNSVYGAMNHGGPVHTPRGDTGTAARFFYSAKASKADRAGSSHPTVKPQALMRYLARLVTPPGGTVLDPFAGSGSTLAAAHAEGFDAVGIEREPEYQADIQRRIDTAEMEGLLT